ncbi:MAG: SpoIIE family protein phosphatase [Planctomycetota bacterium]
MYVLQGKDPDREYELVDKEILVGRDQSCQIAIDADSVSRQHARLALENGTYVIEDLQSRNGTYLNGEKIEGKVRLKEDDRLEIGVTAFVFRSSRPVYHAPSVGSSPSVLCSIDAVAGEDTVAQVNAEGKLRAILRITKSLGKTLDLRALLSRMLEGLFEIFPQADRGLVLLRQGQRLVPAAVKDRRGKPKDVQYSKTIVSKAVAERKAILSLDTARDEEIPVTASITRLQIRSVMCVPLLSQDRKVLGVIQLDIRDRARKFDTHDMEILTSVASQASVSVEHAQLHREMMKHARIQRELDFARDVQHSFLPKTTPEVEGYSFWVHYQAARQVGGDFYDFLRLPNGKEAILLGDVAGKGIPAALMMVRASGLCKLALRSHPDNIAEAMNRLNSEICDVGMEKGFITLVLCVIDPKSHEVTVAIAGHMPPMFRRVDWIIDENVGYDERGRPLGIEREWSYQTGQTRLEPGELVVLFSDGVCDAMNSAEEPYSIDRVREQLLGMKAKGPAEIGQTLMDDVHRHLAGNEQGDDVSLLIFQRDPA